MGDGPGQFNEPRVEVLCRFAVSNFVLDIPEPFVEGLEAFLEPDQLVAARAASPRQRAGTAEPAAADAKSAGARTWTPANSRSGRPLSRPSHQDVGDVRGIQRRVEHRNQVHRVEAYTAGVEIQCNERVVHRAVVIAIHKAERNEPTALQVGKR